MRGVVTSILLIELTVESIRNNYWAHFVRMCVDMLYTQPSWASCTLKKKNPKKMANNSKNGENPPFSSAFAPGRARNQLFPCRFGLCSPSLLPLPRPRREARRSSRLSASRAENGLIGPDTPASRMRTFVFDHYYPQGAILDLRKRDTSALTNKYFELR